MNRTEAYKILELDSSASEEDIKKQFRKLAAKYHPDVNKDPDAVNKSKAVSEAYQILKEPSKVPFEVPSYSDFFNINDFFNQQQTYNVAQNFHPPYPLIYKHITINFEESVLGCSKKIEIDRFVACESCSGIGGILDRNKPCTTCQGKGFTSNTQRSNNFYTTFQQPCHTCFGVRFHKDPCEGCKGEGAIKTKSSFDVKLPAGIRNGNEVRLPGGGSFSRPHKQYDPAVLKVTVIPEANMHLEGDNVVSIVEIPFLDSLTGNTIQVKTVLGEKDLIIPAKVRNGIKLKLPNLGVNGGNHIFILDVKLPNNIDNLIEFLKKEQNGRINSM